MSIQHFSAVPKSAIVLLLAAAVVVISIWSTSGSYASLSNSLHVADSTIYQCRDQADVLAALDRSRNGISLSCNSDTVSNRVVR